MNVQTVSGSRYTGVGVPHCVPTHMHVVVSGHLPHEHAALPSSSSLNAFLMQQLLTEPHPFFSHYTTNEEETPLSVYQLCDTLPSKYAKSKVFCIPHQLTAAIVSYF